MNIRELEKPDGSVRGYTHKTKGGAYIVMATGLAAGEIGDVFDSVVVYRNDHGDVFVRSIGCFNDKMEIIG